MATVLNRDDLEAIEAKIAEVEKGTAGEIVVHVVERSDDYAVFRLAWSVLFAALTTKALSLELPFVADWPLEVAAGLTLLLWLVFGVPAVLRWLVPAPAKQARVHRRAQLGFMQNQVFRTRDASGVLILVSLLEHRVEILADRGIHAKVGVGGWTRYVQRIVEAIRSGRPAEGLIEIIERIGEELKAMPARPDDTNELSNEVIVSAD